MLSIGLRYWVRNGVYFGLAILLVSMGLGCASTDKTTKTETVVTYPNEGEQEVTTTVTTSGNLENREVAEKSETTTTTTQTKDEHPGILGSTFRAIGYVISIPFIIVGGVFRMIFGG